MKILFHFPCPLLTLLEMSQTSKEELVASAHVYTAKEKIHISKAMSTILRHRPEDCHMDDSGWVAIDELIGALKGWRERHVTKNDILLIVSECPKQRFSVDESVTKIRAKQGHTMKLANPLLHEITAKNIAEHMNIIRMGITAKAAKPSPKGASSETETKNDDTEASAREITQKEGPEKAGNDADAEEKQKVHQREDEGENKDEDEQKENDGYYAYHTTTPQAWLAIKKCGYMTRMSRTHIHFSPDMSMIRNRKVLLRLDMLKLLQQGGQKLFRSDNNVILSEQDITLDYITVIRGALEAEASH